MPETIFLVWEENSLLECWMPFSFPASCFVRTCKLWPESCRAIRRWTVASSSLCSKGKTSSNLRCPSLPVYICTEFLFTKWYRENYFKDNSTIIICQHNQDFKRVAALTILLSLCHSLEGKKLYHSLQLSTIIVPMKDHFISVNVTECKQVELKNGIYKS